MPLVKKKVTRSRTARCRPDRVWMGCGHRIEVRNRFNHFLISRAFSTSQHEMGCYNDPVIE